MAINGYINQFFRMELMTMDGVVLIDRFKPYGHFFLFKDIQINKYLRTEKSNRFLITF